MKPRIEKARDGSVFTYYDFPTEEEKLVTLFKELFLTHWKGLVFGPCIDGAVFEITLKDAPKDVTYSTAYLTVDTGPWHFHLCLGKPKTDPLGLYERRTVAKISFFESKNKSCVPASYGLRLWNGAGDQMITVFFPNPYLNEFQKIQKPDWSKLALWKEIKEKYAGQFESSEVPKEAPLDPVLK